MGSTSSDNAALGFAAISPVVGLYAVVLVGMTVAGPAWVWVLPVALAGQCLLLAVYAELASEFPVAGGAYQWTRRLVGPGYGWMSGWVAICAYCAANTTVAYLGAPWALTSLGIAPTANAIVMTGMVLVVVCAVVGAHGVDVLRRAIRAGIAAEIVASVGIGLALLLVFRTQDVSHPHPHARRRGALRWIGRARGCSPRSPSPAGCSSASTPASAPPRRRRGAARHVPRAIWLALLSVAALVILNAFAVTLAHPDPAGVVAGHDIDPVTTSVVTSFGSWSAKPFAAVVLVAFLACGTAAQALTARTIFSIARDDVLPGSRFLRRVDRRKAPLGAIVATTVRACSRPAARPRLGRRRQPDRLRHGGDLRRLPPRRARRADRAAARDVGSRGPCAARARRRRRQRPRGGLARLRERQHRLAADVAGAPGRARVPGLGGRDRAAADRVVGGGIPARRQAAAQARGPRRGPRASNQWGSFRLAVEQIVGVEPDHATLVFERVEHRCRPALTAGSSRPPGSGRRSRRRVARIRPARP